MKKLEVSILLAFIFSIILSIILPFFNKCDKLKENIIRVHILANSDSRQDQRLKYKIKDNISTEVSKLLHVTKTKNNAKQIVFNNLKHISQLSKNEIIKNGYDYDVNVFLAKSYFPTRKYDEFVLPAGTYDALKVVIGKGQGKNWWCVAFPPMCSPIYSDEQNIEDILGEEQLEMIKKPCEYKFAIIELISNINQKLFNKIRDN